MASSVRPTRIPAPLGAVACLALLALAALAITPEPPADPALDALGAILRRALLTPLESLFLLGLFGGATVLAVAIAFALYAFFRGKRTDWLRRRLWQTLLAYAFLTLVAALMPTRRAADRPILPAPGQAPLVAPITRNAAPPAPPAPLPVGSPWPLLVAAGVLLAGLGVLLAGLRPRAVPEPALPRAEESARLASARRRLELGDRVRDAIIACYAEMCGLFEARTAAVLTAREFAAQLRSRGAGDPEILVLTAVFEKARYAAEPCDETDRSRALAALESLERHYRRPEAGP